jgi:hypothetical protein
MDRKKTVAKVQGRASAVAEKVRDAKLEERAAELAALAREKVRDAELDARAAELAALAREAVHSSGIDDAAADLVARARNTVVVQQATGATAQLADSARETTERTLDRVGEWIGDGKVGDALGLRRRRRRLPRWSLLVGAAVAAGAAAGMVVYRRRETSSEVEWDLGSSSADSGLARSSAPGVALPLEGRVREAIGQDARLDGLGPLNINVVDGTVFVRGSVSADMDQDALRAVIESVDGVTDVDLQVTAGA